MARYRPNVAFILRKTGGEILLCERSDRSDCWQFPQGGMKNGESMLAALHREVEEELGLPPAGYHILDTKGPYRYEFPEGYKKSAYDGQEQHYFLAELIDSQAVIKLDPEEFQAMRWLQPAAYDLGWVGTMKRAVYEAVFRDFFGIGQAGNAGS